jgi:hypothetical protein
VIDLIVWSRDRACQLDLLLRSIKENADLFKVSVLYLSSDSHKESYEKLISEHTDINFVLEKNFRTDTISLVESCNSHVCFSTDDMVFYRKSPYNIKMFESFLPSYNSVFSFRLGLNTTKQDIHKDTYQPALSNYSIINDNIIGWQTRYYHPLSNYGYPIALDTHIFPISSFLPIMKNCNWINSNTLEGSMQLSAYRYEFMFSFKESLSVNVPVNNMSNFTISGQKYNYSTEYLRDMYMSGKKISLDFSSEQIIGCHQELGFEFHG